MRERPILQIGYLVINPIFENVVIVPTRYAGYSKVSILPSAGMAPAIVHFLVGAAIVLFLVTPLAMRYSIDGKTLLWIVLIGGIWGLVPDIHHLTPIYHSQFLAFHYSPWADLFGLHHTLDRPYVRERFHESIIGAILLFTLSIASYSVATADRTQSTFAETQVADVLALVILTGLVLLLVSPLAGGFAEIVVLVRFNLLPV